MKQRILSFCLVLALLCALLPQVALPASAATVSSGTTGKLKWTLDDAGTLTISGSGAMPDYGTTTNSAPWKDSKDSIVKVVVKEQKDGAFTIQGYSVIPCCLSSTDGVNDYRPVPYEDGTDEYARTISKLDGSFNGPDLNVDYSDIRQ